ncbi:MAG: VWA domain-containing protein [Acidobacteriaceae bacterium]|nr:VWA domain-containing protein [Acidobacteriaceae bacterium]
MGFAVAALLLQSLGSSFARAQQGNAAPPANTAPSASDSSEPTSVSVPPQGVQGSSAERGSDGTFLMHENVSEVRLNITVLDSSGRSIQTLDKDAFHIREDGVPQAITSFRHEDLPVSLGILIDSSGSMYDKQAAVNAAALDLMKLSNPQDEAFLVDFSWQTMVDQDFTSDIGKLQQGLSYISPKGETAVYDALVASADYLTRNAKHPKQVLLIITDGEDNASSATLDQAIRSIQDLDGPVVYCIGLLFGDSASEAHHARKVLEDLAEQTGGAAYFPKSVKEVDGIAREVANDIRTQYTITYSSTKPSELGGYRAIRVEAKAKGFHKLSVRTRSGYYPRLSKTLTHKTLTSPAQ